MKINRYKPLKPSRSKQVTETRPSRYRSRKFIVVLAALVLIPTAGYLMPPHAVTIVVSTMGAVATGFIGFQAYQDRGVRTSRDNLVLQQHSVNLERERMGNIDNLSAKNRKAFMRVAAIMRNEHPEDYDLFDESDEDEDEEHAA